MENRTNIKFQRGGVSNPLVTHSADGGDEPDRYPQTPEGGAACPVNG